MPLQLLNLTLYVANNLRARARALRFFFFCPDEIQRVSPFAYEMLERGYGSNVGELGF